MLTPVLLTITGTDPSGGAGLQVSAFFSTILDNKANRFRPI